MLYLNFNGAIIRADKKIITADNRGLRYGDGIFETMKLVDGILPLAELHFERLWQGIELMQFETPAYFNAGYLSAQVVELAKKNNHHRNARIRIMIFRSDGGLYDPQNMVVNYTIQSWELPSGPPSLNENGLLLDIYPDARKTFDSFSHLKSNNYLPYLMAALYAKSNRLNDCFVLNANGNICDSTIANVFIVKDQLLFTPSLTEGAVGGVMRKYLLGQFPAAGFLAHEKILGLYDIREADEIFLTNAVQGLKWVGKFRDNSYSNTISTKIFNTIVRNIF